MQQDRNLSVVENNAGRQPTSGLSISTRILLSCGLSAFVNISAQSHKISCCYFTAVHAVPDLPACLQLLEKLRREAAATAEPVAAASGSGPGDARKVALRLPRPPPCFTEVLDIQKLSVGWRTPSNAFTATTVGSGSAVDTAAAGAVPVLADVNFTISKGQRVLVLGPNGAGKSTLLKALAGRLQPWSGSIKQGEGVKLGESGCGRIRHMLMSCPKALSLSCIWYGACVVERACL